MLMNNVYFSCPFSLTNAGYYIACPTIGNYTGESKKKTNKINHTVN